jgi:hypothetical protein
LVLGLRAISSLGNGLKRDGVQGRIRAFAGRSGGVAERSIDARPVNRAAFELAAEEGYALAIGAEQHVMSASGLSRRHLPPVNDTEAHAVVVARFKKALAA